MHDPTRARSFLASLSALLLLAITTSLPAQDHGAALGVTGGWSRPGDLTPGFATPTELEPGWSAGFQVEGWPGKGRVGIRASGSYGSRSVAGEPDQAYDLLSGDLALLIRMLPQRDRPWVVPFVSIGAGASLFSADGAPPLGDGQYGSDPVLRPAAVAGAGFDLLPSGRFGLRIEAADRIIFPSVGESPPHSGTPMAHNLEVTAGVQLRLGSPPGPTAVAIRTRGIRGARSREADAPAATASDRDEAALGATAGAGPEEARGSEQAREPQQVRESGVTRAPEREGARERTEQLFTVQLGSSMDEETARRWQERLRGYQLPVWITVTEVSGARINRLRVGVLPNEVEARGLARKLAAEFGWSTAVDRVGADERTPADAVSATRAFLWGGA